MNFAGVFVFTFNNINKMYTLIRFYIEVCRESLADHNVDVHTLIFS